jgi:hypothetical protein
MPQAFDMNVGAPYVFRLFGGIIDECLDICDVLCRTAAYKDACKDALPPTRAILYVQTNGDVGDPLTRHLMNHARPMTMDRADEIVEVMGKLYCYGIEGPMAYIEPGDLPIGGEDKAWDCIVTKLREWAYDETANSKCCDLDSLDDYLTVLLHEPQV